jgi:hypothetical protein
VPSCAGAYVSGAAGSNKCPAGSARIEAEAACRTAAAAAGKTAGSPFVETQSAFPRGCYYDTRDNNSYFNTHAVGAGFSTQLLCATLVATTGARAVSPPARVCAGTARVLCGVHDNDTNGRNIDTRTYIKRYIYTCIYTYDSDGARRRCRAAHGSAGGRRAGVNGHGT